MCGEFLRRWCGVLAAAAVALAGGSAAARASSPPADLSNVYRLQARFDPASGALEVEGTLTIVADERREEIALLLNKALDVRRFTYGGRAAVIERDVKISGQALPKTQRLRLPLARPLEKGERLELSFAYGGRLTTEDIEIGRGVISPKWTELTMEALWFPALLEEPMVRSEVFLSLPKGYGLTAPGRVERLADGRWRLDPGGPVAGRITFVLSDSWVVTRRPLGGGRTAALYTVAEEPRAGALLDAVGGAYAFYESLFGPPRTEKSAITLLFANRDVGLKYPNQAYSTAGDFIVLDGSAPQAQQDTLHHEVAHLWWSAGRPGTPDEFMSESVSEYLAIRRSEMVFGAAWLAERRKKLSASSEAIKASVSDIAGFGPTRQPLMYERGPAALWTLHDRIGAAAMDRLLKAAYAGRVDTLEGFITLLRRQQGAATAEAFRKLL